MEGGRRLHGIPKSKWVVVDVNYSKTRNSSAQKKLLTGQKVSGLVGLVHLIWFVIKLFTKCFPLTNLMDFRSLEPHPDLDPSHLVHEQCKCFLLQNKIRSGGKWMDGLHSLAKKWNEESLQITSYIIGEMRVKEKVKKFQKKSAE